MLEIWVFLRTSVEGVLSQARRYHLYQRNEQHNAAIQCITVSRYSEETLLGLLIAYSTQTSKQNPEKKHFVAWYRPIQYITSETSIQYHANVGSHNMMPELLQIENQISAGLSLKSQSSITHKSERVRGIILDLKMLGAEFFYTCYIDRQQDFRVLVLRRLAYL